MMNLDSKRLVSKIKDFDKLTVAGIQYAAFISGKQLKTATSKEILRKPKSGRVYIRRTASGRRRRHVASAAGETHANMTGTLRRSLSFRVNTTSLEFGYGVTKGNAPNYAKFVENGTRKMGPRPSLMNGIKATRRSFQNNFEREIGKRIGALV